MKDHKINFVLHFIAMQRSGHHAIIYWVGKNSNNGAILYNNCLWMKDNAPSSIIEIKNSHRVPTTVIWNSENLPVNKCENAHRKRYCNVCDPNHIGIVCNTLFEAPSVLAQISSCTQQEIVVLRSPENWLASFLKYKRARHLSQLNRQLSYKEISDYLEVYKQHLETALVKKDQFRSISFDKWFCDKSYRVKLMKKLKLADLDNDQSLNLLSPHGGGSSFDYLRYSTSPREMDVLNRWELYIDDAQFLKALSDRKLVALTKEYFGKYSQLENIIKWG